mgnify:CR=1 FL=1
MTHSNGNPISKIGLRHVVAKNRPQYNKSDKLIYSKCNLFSHIASNP